MEMISEVNIITQEVYGKHMKRNTKQVAARGTQKSAQMNSKMVLVVMNHQFPEPDIFGTNGHSKKIRTQIEKDGKKSIDSNSMVLQPFKSASDYDMLMRLSYTELNHPSW